MIDVLNVDVNIPVKVVFEKCVDARMLKNEVLKRIANISCAKVEISEQSLEGSKINTYDFRLAP